MDKRWLISARRLTLLAALFAMGYCAAQAATHLPVASLSGDPQISELARRLDAAETALAVMRAQFDDLVWLARGVFGGMATLIGERVYAAFKGRT